MALNLKGEDIITIGGGPSPADGVQDAKILTLENKTQNINSVNTDNTKTEFINKVIVPEIDQSTNKFYVYNNDENGVQVNNKDNTIPKFDIDGKKIQHSNFFITDDNNYGSILENKDINGSANCFFGVNQTASGFSNIHIGRNITAGNNLNNNNILLGGFLQGGNGEYNISIGGNSGSTVSTHTGIQNVSIGNAAGNGWSSGGRNVFLGALARSNIDCTASIGIGYNSIVRRNNEAVINTSLLRPDIDNICDIGTTSTDPLHVSRFRNLNLSGNINNVNTFSSALVQAPIIAATSEISTEKITNLDNPSVLSIELKPTTGIITIHKDILPNVGNTLNIGTNTAGGRMNEINAQILLANQEVRSNKHYNENGTAGIDIGNTATGAVNLTGNKYQGKNNQIVTLNGSGQIQQPSQNALIDSNGNATFKNLELLNIASSGEIKAKILQSNDAANTLSLLNRSTIAGKGIIIDNTTNGNIQLTGDAYINDPNRFIRLNTNGTLEKTPIICDGPTNNNISGINTLSATTTVSSNMLNSGNIYSPNLFLGTFGGGNATAGTMNINSGNITNTGDITPITDNTEDIGTLALSYKDIHIKGDVYKNGVVYSTGGGGGGVTNCYSEVVLLKEVGTIVASGATTVQTRNLNTIINPGNYTWCSLSAPTFTLSNGTYAIMGRGTAYVVNHTQAYIYNVTDGVYENVDQPIMYNTNVDILIDVPCYTIITVSGGAKQYQFRQWTETANAIGLSGNKSGANLLNNPSGANNSLAEVRIIKIGQQVQPSNAEFDNIVLKWNAERSNNNLAVSKIYLPVGVPVGSFDYKIHNVYLALEDATNNTKIIYDVKFIDYQGSTAISETKINNINNAVEIYNAGSTAHPNNVVSTNLKTHITRHFTSDYDFSNYPSFNITSVPRVCVPSALVSSWTETDPIAVTFGVNGGAPFSSFYISTLYGSQNGFTNVSTNSSAIPAGYIEIF